MKPSTRLERLTPNFFAGLEKRIAAMQASNVDVVRLDIGSPDLPPAAHILEALNRAACDPSAHGYTPHIGSLTLRQAWAEMYRRAWGIEIDPHSQVVPLLGSKEGIFHLMQALLEPEDVVLVPDPGYITYTQGAQFAGAQPITMPMDASYRPSFEEIPPEVARRARIVWLNYPNNPTAAVADLEFFNRAVDYARRYDLLLCHDAAYAQVNFDGYQSPSLLQVPGASEIAVEFNTLSKSHNMAGWRVGAALGNPDALRALFRLKTSLDSGHFHPIHAAAIAAMTGDQSWLVERNAIYQERRDLVLSTLRRLGFSVVTPLASLYVWFPVLAGQTSLEFATQALENAQVSLVPGTVFGNGGEGFVRLSVTSPTPRIAEAMYRLETWLG